MKDSQVIVYENGEVELSISIEDDTVWIAQKQLSMLFEVEIHTINYHIKNIYKQKELSKDSTIRKIRIVQKEGSREVKRNVEHYNLDMIISVGYRVNSLKATKFRQWATEILKEYIVNGYAINTHKITEQRLLSLENDMQIIKSKIKSSELDVKQGIFYDGQIWDAYIFVNDLLKRAKKEVILIDNYIDEAVLVLFSKYKNLHFTIITQKISKQLKLDIEKYNKQYSNLTLKTSNRYHDRFLLVDDKEAYHIGASLKDLGRRVFAFSKIDITLIKDK